MSTRRDFLNLTVKGSAMAAAAALLPQGLSAQVNTGDGSADLDMRDKLVGAVQTIALTDGHFLEYDC